MKINLFVAAICFAFFGCVSSENEENSPNPLQDAPEYNLGNSSSDHTNPCGKPTYQTFNVDGGTVTFVIPSLCHQYLGPDHGDPPDHQKRTNPLDTHSTPQVEPPAQQSNR